MRKRYEAVLPPGYTAVYTVDATRKKTAVLLNLAGAGIMVLSMLTKTAKYSNNNVQEHSNINCR